FQVSPPETHEMKNMKQKIIHELVEVGGVMVYLALVFLVLQTFKCTTLLVACSENDFLASYITALLAAVGLGKFVFVLEKMPIANKFKTRPLIVPVIYKTIVFTILVNFILHAEDRVMHRPSALEHITDPLKFWLCLASHELAFFVTFFIFFCFRDMSRVIGEAETFRLFFINRNSELEPAPDPVPEQIPEQADI
ncbi:MAG: hypothetical protein KC777_25535, partial [Cyanobacteria bacterium HKST-UBA02]|nr:hypothetical protein [Cyanobacteria bacterium HKST-UBA02]